MIYHLGQDLYPRPDGHLYVLDSAFEFQVFSSLLPLVLFAEYFCISSTHVYSLKVAWSSMDSLGFPLSLHIVSGKHMLAAALTITSNQQRLSKEHLWTSKEHHGQLSFSSPLGTCEPFPCGQGLGKAWSPTAAKRSNIASPSPWIQRSRLLGQACPIRCS